MYRALICGLLAAMLAGCNLGSPAPTPIPTPDLPSAEITAPPNNRQVVEGVEFDIEIVARDSTAGIAKVELYVDEELINEAAPADSSSVPVFAVTMNWRAAGAGFHIVEAIPYREDGTQGDPAAITIEVLSRESSTPESTDESG